MMRPFLVLDVAGPIQSTASRRREIIFQAKRAARWSLRSNQGGWAMTALPSIDKVLRSATEAGYLPGVVAAAATREGPIYQGAAGKRALPAGPDITVDSVFWIASMTKAVTSTAAMQLVERGKLQLDQPISEVLPELASPQVLEGFDAAGEPKLRPAKRPI